MTRPHLDVDSVRLENEQREKNVERFLDAIGNELQILSRRANDRGAWEDTYKFAADRNETFQHANAVDETFTNTDTDFLCFLTMQNEVTGVSALIIRAALTSKSPTSSLSS
jgi:sensor domain CHASE-containing protein